jgi:uncharacterized protein YecE (DUF72 family)
MDKKNGKVYIGTSGWHYSHWKGSFYPKDFPEKQFLSYYIQQFSTVEINRTFYSLPERRVFLRYAQIVPRSFIFSVKASRFITHVKRLQDPKESLHRFFKSVSGLKDRLGPILFQLPPHWKVNPDRLRTFLKALPKGHRYTFELRDPSWLTEEIYELLRQYRAALCIYEFESHMTPKIATADFIYVRLHGPKRTAYQGRYPLTTLKKWATFFRKETKKGHDVYCYFDNDEAGFAAINALELLDILKKK